MRPSALRCVLWKEMRAQGSFAIAVIGLAMFIQLFLVLGTFVNNSGDMTTGIISIALALAAMYAAGSAGTTFAGEIDAGTFGLLRRMPTTERVLFHGKMLWCIGSSTALFLVLWAESYLMSVLVDEPPTGQFLRSVVGTYGIAVFEMIVWCAYFSLRWQRPLVATIAGIAMTGVSAFMCAYLATNTLGWDVDVARHPALSSYAVAWAFRLLVIFAVGAIDYRLGRRWFQHWTLKASQPDDGDGSGDASPVWGDRWSAKQAPGGTFKRLCRQHFRQSRLWIGIGLVVPIVTLVIYWITELASNRGVVDDDWQVLVMFLLIGSAVSTLVFAGTTFLEDQRKRQYRFLAHHGASPKQIWWSRQLVWGGVTLLGLAIVGVNFVVHYVMWRYGRGRPDEFTVICMTVGSLAAGIYAAGQLSSQLLRSGLLAIALTFGLAFAFCTWESTAAVFFGAARLATLLPLAVAMLIASRLHTNDWLLERRSWRTRLKWITPPAAVCLAIVIAFPAYRVYSVPYVEDVGFSVEEYRTLEKRYQEDSEWRSTIERLARLGREDYIVDELSQFEPVSNNDFDARGRLYAEASELYGPATAIIEVVDDGIYDVELWWHTPEMEEELLSLARRGLLEDAYRVGAVHDFRYGPVHNTAFHYMEEGDLKKSLDWYLAALQLARPGGIRVDMMSDYTYPTLRGRWADSEGMTPELLREAIHRLDRIRPEDYGLRVETEQLYAFHFSRIDDLEYMAGMMDGTELRTERIMYRLLPWEVARVQRLARWYCAKELAKINAYEEYLRDPADGDKYSRARAIEDELSERYWENTNGSYFSGRHVPIHQAIEAEAERQATQLILAIKAYRLEHDGELPPSLDVLVGDYIDEIPYGAGFFAQFHYHPNGKPLPEGIKLPDDAIPEGVDVEAIGSFDCINLGKRLNESMYGRRPPGATAAVSCTPLDERIEIKAGTPFISVMAHDLYRLVPTGYYHRPKRPWDGETPLILEARVWTIDEP